MKKIFALLLACVMALALFGCSPAENPNGTQDQGNQQTPNGSSGTGTPTSDVDYSGDMTGWMYAPENYDDEVTTSLVNIDSATYGDAGSSLKGLLSGYHVLRLAGRDDLAGVETYLDAMNPTQRDYFSFQWQQAMATARNMLADTDTYSASLKGAGVEDFDLGSVNIDRLNALNSTMTGYLTSRGVTDAWKNHTNTEPFSLVGGSSGMSIQ